MREIELSKNGKHKGKYIALVDDEDYDYLIKWNWHVRMDKNNLYAVKYIQIDGKNRDIPMHRIIMKNPLGMEVDHIDHDGLNNQKSNLRNCTSSQNNMNRSPRGKSKYLGVSYCGGSITAYITINKKNKCLGCFKNEEDAAKAYDEAAKLIHNEFANLNFK